MNINLEIQNAVDKYIVERLPEVIDKKVDLMIDKILDDIFCTYSDVAKDIKNKIEEKLDINLQRFDMIDYNAMIAQAIQKKLVSLINEGSVAPITTMIQDITGFIKKKQIKLSEIHQMVRDAAIEEHSHELDGQFSFHVEKNRKYNWLTISFDTLPNISQKECSITFMISTNSDSGTIFSFSAGSYYKSDKGPITPARLAMLSDLEHRIFRLYSAQVKIVPDLDNIDFDNFWSQY